MATGINLPTKCLIVAPNNNENNSEFKDSERDIAFDHLVLAVGAAPRVNLCPGATDHGLTFYSQDDAKRLREELDRIVKEKRKEKSRTRSVIQVVVVGGR